MNYDMKLSPLFSGCLMYEKTDYINDTTLQYDFHFKDGEIHDVMVSYHKDGKFHTKFSGVKNWNSEFWIKAPQSMQFDDCNWKRVGMFLIHPTASGASYYSNGYVECII